MAITEQKDHLDFAKIGDTGQDNIDAIGPITDGQPATQSTFRRPSENLRERTEDIRQAVEDSFYLRDVQPMAIATFGDITWEGTVLDGGTGKILQAENLILKPFLSPSTDTKASISIGVALTNQITYTVSAAGFATQGMNRVFIEHRNGGVATVLAASISDGPVKRILVTFDSANPLHDAATTKGLVDAAIAADSDLNGKITVTINAAPVQTILAQAETRFEGTAEAEVHILAAGVLDTFTTANPLKAGDTVAIWYRYLVDPLGGFDGRRESTSSHGTTAVPAASLFITNDEPSKIPGAIPICTVLPGFVSALLFIDGTLFNKDDSHILGTVTAALVPYNGGPAWADTTTNPPDTVEAQLDKIISDLGQGVAGTAKVSSDALVASAPGNDAVGASALFAQLQTLLDLINDRADLTDLTAQIFKGLLTLEKTVTFKQGDVPLGATPRISMEEATVPTNLLILESRVLTAPDRYIRVYSGSTLATTFQVTFNAKWDGTGLWLSDTGISPAVRFTVHSDGTTLRRLNSPPVSWAEAVWTSSGNTGTSIFGGVLEGKSFITAGNTISNTAGDIISALGHVRSTNGDITALSGSARAQNFFYSTVVNTSTILPHWLGTNAFDPPGSRFLPDNSDGTLKSNGLLATYFYQFQKPYNYNISSIDIAYRNNLLRVAPFNAYVEVLVKYNHDFTGPIAAPQYISLGVLAFPLTAGNVVVNFPLGSFAIDPADHVVTVSILDAGGADDKILGVRVNWTDAGPRNI